jgi:hypothetical protein
MRLRFGWLAACCLVLAFGCSSGSDATDAATDPGGDAPADLSADAVDAASDAAPDVAPGDVVPDETLPPFVEGASRVLYDLDARPIRMPVPANWYLDPTDGGLVFDAALNSADLLPLVSTNYVYRQAFRATRGFAPYAPFVFLTSVPVDPASLPADGAASVLPASAVQIVRLDDAGAPVEHVALRAAFETIDTKDQGPRHLTTVVPLRPLAAGQTYAFVITDALRDVDGNPFGPAAGFAAVSGQAGAPEGADEATRARIAAERERLAPVLAKLDAQGAVIAATDVTIGTAVDETADILAAFRKGGAISVIPYSLDGDGDGTPDAVPGSAFADCPMDTGLALGVAGTFEPVNYTGPDDEFHRDADGQLQVFPQPGVKFWLMVPTGTGPHPVVVAMHGIDSNHGEACGFGRELVQKGYAVLRFDWPRHGDRGSGGFAFLDVFNPFKVRDNFRQSFVDLASALVLIDELAGDPALQAAGGLDASRIGYYGHSLGSILGLATLVHSDRVQCLASTVGGAGLFHMVEIAIADKLKGFERYTLLGVVHGAEHILAGGDGAGWESHLVSDTLPGTVAERFLLHQEVINDGTVPNPSSDILARASGIPLIEPVAKPVDQVPVVPAAGATSGVFQFDGPVHGFFMNGGDNPDTKFAHQQQLHFLDTCLRTGTPEILVP